MRPTVACEKSWNATIACTFAGLQIVPIPRPFTVGATQQWTRRLSLTWVPTGVPRAGVLLGRLGRRLGDILRGCLLWCCRHPTSRRPSRSGSTRQIQEQGVLRALGPDSESEAEVVEDPCHAVHLGLARSRRLRGQSCLRTYSAFG